MMEIGGAPIPGNLHVLPTRVLRDWTQAIATKNTLRSRMASKNLHGFGYCFDQKDTATHLTVSELISRCR